MSLRPRWWAAGASIALLVLGARAGWAQRSAEEAILPLAAYQSQDALALARSYRTELRALYQSVRRCTPELDFHPHGLGFRRPLGADESPPYLATWVWIPSEPPLSGDGIGARSAEAFRRYAPKLLPLLVAREGLRGFSHRGLRTPPDLDQASGRHPADRRDPRRLPPKSAVTPFVAGTATFGELLRKAQIRVFDGQTEVDFIRLEIPDWEVPSGRRAASAVPTCSDEAQWGLSPGAPDAARLRHPVRTQQRAFRSRQEREGEPLRIAAPGYNSVPPQGRVRRIRLERH